MALKMTVQDMIAKKKELGFSCDYIAEKTGIPVSTVRKIFSGATSTPRWSNMEALKSFFWAEEIYAKEEKTKVSYSKEEENGVGYDKEDKTKIYYADGDELGISYADGDEQEISYANEDYGAYGATDGTSALKIEDYHSSSAFKIEDYHNKTLKDYLALPEGMRVELIDGVFYDMASPSALHQRIGGEIFTRLNNFVDSNNGQCIPFIAPMDVQLDCDDMTIVEPDVFIVCDRSKITKPRIFGAPDFIVEVLSRSSIQNDLYRKLWKYKQAGVREYWVVMPDQLQIKVFEFEKSDIPTVYTFDDEIPVGIWDGQCKVDFKKVYDKISFML